MNRPRHRYLLVKFLGEDAVSAQDVKEAVEASVEQMFGRFGSAEMKVRLIGLDSSRRIAVLRCELKWVERLRCAVALISQVNRQTAMAAVIRSSGTIKGLGVRIPRRQK